MRIVARGFEQTVSPDADFWAGMPELTTLRNHFTTAANPRTCGGIRRMLQYLSPIANAKRIRTRVCRAST